MQLFFELGDIKSMFPKTYRASKQIKLDQYCVRRISKFWTNKKNSEQSKFGKSTPNY